MSKHYVVAVHPQTWLVQWHQSSSMSQVVGKHRPSMLTPLQQLLVAVPTFRIIGTTCVLCNSNVVYFATQMLYSLAQASRQQALPQTRHQP